MDPGRPLSAPERALWLLDQACCLNGVQVAHVRGPLPPELVEEGLRRAQARHPLWRVHVQGPSAAPRFVDGERRPIPLRVVPRQGPGDWLGPVEEELNRRFAPDDNPLFRAVLVSGADESELILSHHHCVADAVSIIHRFGELLADAAARLEGRALPAPESRPLLPALVDLLPPRGARRLLDMNSFLWRNAGARLREARKLPLEELVPPEARRTRLLHAALGAGETEALRGRCRAEGTTVQGLLGAALLAAVSGDLDGRAVLGCFSTVSLRGDLRPPVGTDTGLFVSQATTFHAIGPDRELWALAREFRTRLVEVLARGEALMTFPWLGLFIPRGADPGPRLVRRVDLAAPAALGITNVGPVPIASEYGPLRLTGLHIALGAGTVVPLLLGVTTVGGRLFCNLLHVEPLYQRARAERARRRLLGLLRAAARPGPVPVASAAELCDGDDP